MYLYRAAVASSPGKGKDHNSDNFYFNSKIITEELASSQVLLSHKKDQKGLQIYAVADGTTTDLFRNEPAFIAMKKLKDCHGKLLESREEQSEAGDAGDAEIVKNYLKETEDNLRTVSATLPGKGISSGIAMLVVSNRKITAVNAGDVRIYRLRSGDIQMISLDDTQSQRMIDKGISTPEKVRTYARKHKLTQSLGMFRDGEYADAHFKDLEAEHGDIFIICTGPFYDAVSEERMKELADGLESPVEIVDALMSDAMDNGVRDNATVMAIQAKDSTLFTGMTAEAAVGAGALGGFVKDAGNSKTVKKSEKLFDKAEEDGQIEENDQEDAPEEDEGTEKKGWIVPAIIVGCLIVIIVLLIFGISMWTGSRKPDPTAAPSVTEVPATSEPTDEPTPTEEATPTPTPTATPTPTPTPTETPTPTPTPTATPEPGNEVPVEMIILSKNVAEIPHDGSIKIDVTFYPENATNKNITWRSSDNNIATVDGSGRIKAVSAGTVNITATPQGGGTAKTLVVTVYNVKAVNVIPDVSELTLNEEETYDLTYTVSPENAYYERVSFTSSDETVATVDENGHITAIKEGVATIVIIFEDGTETPTAGACEVNVLGPVKISEIQLDQTELILKEGDTVTLVATILPEEAEERTLIWTSDADFVTVDENGNVTAVAPGNAVITVSSEDGSVSASCDVIVNARVVAESVDLDKTEMTLLIGETDTLTVTLTPEEVDDDTVEFTSSDESVATVDQEGTVTAVGEGVCQITATATDGGQYATCEVTVRAPILPEEIVLTETNIDLPVGTGISVEPTVLPEEADDKSLSFTSSDESVVTVDEEGNITAVSVGTATVTIVATATEGEGEENVVFAEITVNCTEPVHATEIILSETSITMYVGDIRRRPSVTVLPEEATFTDTIWTIDVPSEGSESDEPGEGEGEGEGEEEGEGEGGASAPDADPIISLTDDGRIEALRPGTVTITVTDHFGEVSAQLTVTVLE